jgi:cytochrome oxidase Cu insertion factor (SCO1/SenC/PrrC family)
VKSVAVGIAATVAVGVIAAAFVFLRGSADAGSSGGAYRGSQPGGRVEMPAFALPRYDGSGVVRSQSLRGRVTVLTFVDSACKSSCPIIVGLLGQALPKLSKSERSQVAALAISVHPKLDTKRNVRRFLADRHALGQLDYLVARLARMKPVWKRFHVLSAAETGVADFHSADVRIFNRNGVWVSTMHVAVDLTVANLLHDIRKALKDTRS